MFVSVSLFAGLWWILTNGSSGSWLIGLPAVAAAVWARARLSQGGRYGVSVIGMVRFVPLFLWQSVRGGVDVARRTLALRMRIKPGFVRYRTQLTVPAARTFFVTCAGLLPGTLASGLVDDQMEIHTLDIGSNHQVDLRRLEVAVARIFMHSEGKS